MLHGSLELHISFNIHSPKNFSHFIIFYLFFCFLFHPFFHSSKLFFILTFIIIYLFTLWIIHKLTKTCSLLISSLNNEEISNEISNLSFVHENIFLLLWSFIVSITNSSIVQTINKFLYLFSIFSKICSSNEEINKKTNKLICVYDLRYYLMHVNWPINQKKFSSEIRK